MQKTTCLRNIQIWRLEPQHQVWQEYYNERIINFRRWGEKKKGGTKFIKSLELDNRSFFMASKK